MAHRRSLSIRANFIARRYNPSFCYILHDDDSKHQSQDETKPLRKINSFLQQRSFGTVLNKSAESSGFFHDRRYSHYSLLPGIGMSSFSRYMSTTVSEGPDKIEYITDVAEVLADTTLQAVASQAPAVNEVAVAAADSFFPVAALQHFIDAVHSFTGLNWWASIVLTTICIRGVTIPLLVNQLKATSKLTLMRPRMEEIKQRMEATGMEPTAMAEGQKEMKTLFKEYGVTPFTPLKGLLIQGPVFISFFLAISNMAEKVPSFKEGGAYWFVDLTTPDSLYIFPALTALSFLITVECNMQEGLEGNPAAGTMKNVSRVLAALTVPLTMGFPKAIFCYWVTSNLFSLMYGLVLKNPGIKKFLGIPEIPKAPPTTAPQSSINLFEVLKRATAMRQARTSLPVESVEPPKLAERKVSSSSVLNQRLKSLEKQVKGRKKGKKSK